MEQPNIAAAPAANVQAAPIDAVGEQEFFDSIIGDTKTPLTSTATVEKAPLAPEDKARERFEYWQGQADRYRQELEKVQPVASEYGRYQPVIEYLKQNPDALETISQMRDKASGPEQNQLPIPVKPVRPTDYNDQDAMTPGTPSFKYERAVNDYRTQLTEYMFAKQELQETRQREIAQMDQAKRLEQQRVSELGNTLVAQYGFTQDQVADFVKVMNSPQSMEMANLVNLYKVIKHSTKNVAEARRSTSPTQNIPPPPLGSGGITAPLVSDEDGFFGEIVDQGRPSNPLMRIAR